MYMFVLIKCPFIDLVAIIDDQIDLFFNCTSVFFVYFLAGSLHQPLVVVVIFQLMIAQNQNPVEVRFSSRSGLRAESIGSRLKIACYYAVIVVMVRLQVSQMHTVIIVVIGVSCIR